MKATRFLAVATLTLSQIGCERLLTPSLYGTVTAEVTRRDGTPVPGASLMLYTGQRPMGYGTTDTLGRYVFEDVPDGAYGVLARPPRGYVRLETLLPTTTPSEVVDNLQITGGTTRAARFRFLKDGPGSVDVQVREGASTPISGLTAILYAPTGEVRRSTTDANGRVQFAAVPFGIYGVIVERPALYRDSGEVALPYIDGLVMEAGASERATFTFEKCQGTITAQVVDQSGRAVPGAQLVFYSGATVLARDSLPAEGQRSYGPLLCADYGFRVLLPRGYTATNQRGSEYLDGLRVRRNGQLRALLTVQRLPRGTVRVRIVDQEARPVAAARTVLYNSSGVIRDLRTGTDGTVLMDTILMSEPHGVRVVNPRGYLLGEGNGISYVDQLLLADGEQRELLFRMQRTGRAELQLRVVDQDDRPVESARLVLYTGQGVERDERTGASGTLTFGDVIIEAEYGLRVVPPPGGRYTVEEGRGISFVDGIRLTNGDVRPFTFRLRRFPP